MNRVNTPIQPPDRDSIDLADILLTLAENARLLVIGPIVVGALAFGLAHLLPQKFESSAILKAEPAVATYMTSASVLDSALRKLGYLKDLDEDEAEDARIRLMGRVSAQAGRNDQMITLRVTGTSPEAAQRMASEILNQTFEGSKPRENELKRLTAEKDILSQQVVELVATSKAAQRILEKGTATDNLGSVAASIAAISSNLIRVQEGIHKVEQKMTGLTSDDLIQSPTLPRKPYAPRKPLVAVLALLASGLFLLIFVFIRQSWRTSPSMDQHAARLNAIKRKYRLGR